MSETKDSGLGNIALHIIIGHEERPQATRFRLQPSQFPLQLDVLLLEEGGSDGDLVLLCSPGVPTPLGRQVVLPPALPVGLVLGVPRGEEEEAGVPRPRLAPSVRGAPPGRRLLARQLLQHVLPEGGVVAKGVRVDPDVVRLLLGLRGWTHGPRGLGGQLGLGHSL